MLEVVTVKTLPLGKTQSESRKVLVDPMDPKALGNPST